MSEQVKLEIMRGADYPTWEEAQKDGAIYSVILQSQAHAEGALLGMELASQCINMGASKLAALIHGADGLSFRPVTMVTEGAMEAAMHMTDGLVSHPDHPFNEVLEVWGMGCLDLFSEVGHFAPLCMQLCDAGYKKHGEGPGVYFYEVAYEFGNRYAAHIMEHACGPDREYAEEMLRELDAKFWAQRQPERVVRVEAPTQMMTTVTVVGWLCESVGGFDWFWKREDALAEFKKRQDDPDYRELYLSSHMTADAIHDEVNQARINTEIDEQLDLVEQSAELIFKRPATWGHEPDPDADEFKCPECSDTHDIEDSIRCPECGELICANCYDTSAENQPGCHIHRKGCKACGGRGFILADNGTRLEVQRCDSCNTDVDDNEMARRVYELSVKALDSGINL